MKAIVIRSALAGMVFAMFMTACDEEPHPSLFNPDEVGKPQPVVTAVQPPDSTFGGVGEITIQGQNFSSVPSENLVFFGAQRTTVLAASPTELTVASPNLIADRVGLRVAVQGAELFSDPFYYKLVPAVVEYGSFRSGELGYGITSDVNGNLFVSTNRSNIIRVTPANRTSIYSMTPFLKTDGMRMGPNDVIYLALFAGRARFVQAIEPANPGNPRSIVSFSKNPRDLDFDANLNLWTAAGDEIHLVRISNNTRVLKDTYPAELVAVRVFDGHLYVAGRNNTTGEQKIWRSTISGEELGVKEVAYELTGANWLEDARVLCMTFAADGDLYLGTDHPAGIFVMHPDGSAEPLYEGLLAPQIYAMTWPAGEQALYATAQLDAGTANASSTIFKINLAKDGAPYYGVQ